MPTHSDQRSLLELIKTDGFSRDIFLVLLIKLTLIILLWWLFFDVPDAKKLSPEQIGQQIMSSTTTHHVDEKAVISND